MSIITPSALTATVQTMYETAYREAQDAGKAYDQFAGVTKQHMPDKGNSVTVTFHSDLAPDNSPASRTADKTPQSIYEASVAVNTDFYKDGVKVHETSFMESFALGMKNLGALTGRNKNEVIDSLARTQATQGNWVLYGTNHSTRVTLDVGDAGDRLLESDFLKVSQLSQTWAGNQLPDQSIICLTDVYAVGDLLSAASSTILLRQGYTEQGLKWLQNGEIGTLHGIRVVKSPLAKVFYGAGADNASPVATTLSSAASPLDTHIHVTANTNIAVGQWLTIGTVESSTTEYLTTEVVYVTSISTTNIRFIGGGVNGGLRFAHDSGAAVENGDSVHTAVFGGPNSLAKVYGSMGEYGEMVGPKVDGSADDFIISSWKYWGGYGRINEAWLIRRECSSSNQ